MKLFNKLLGVSFLLLIVYLAFSWAISAKKIKELCVDVKENQLITNVIQEIENSWYLEYRDFDRDNINIILVHSPSNFGRHTCKIEHKNGKVLSTSYLFLD